MKRFARFIFVSLALLVAASAANAQTITGPSTLGVGLPVTVTWSGSLPANCASGAQVVLNLNNTWIAMSGAVLPGRGNSVTFTGPRGVANGTRASLALKSLCTGYLLTAAYPVTITSSASSTPTASSSLITPAVQQSIDSACQQVLGYPCSTYAPYSSTYTIITQQINQRQLGSDMGSIMNNYLIPMVASSTSWQYGVIDNAWRAANCQAKGAGPSPEAQWAQRVSSWKTYESLYNTFAANCGGAGTNATTSPAAARYLTAQQMSAAYQQVWGSAYAYATISTTCPTPASTTQIAAQAVSCARGALTAYVQSHGTSVLQTIASPIFQIVIGAPMSSAQAQTIAGGFGRTWTGADDLLTYLQSNSSQFRTALVVAGLDAQGCLIDSTRKRLAQNEPCGMYYVGSTGIHSPAAYSVVLNGRTLTAPTTGGGGLLVNNQGIPVRIVGPSAGTWQIVAGGQIVAAGGGNIVAAGGGNIVAAGGGNIVAAGGGNVVNTNGSNLQFDSPAYAATLPVLMFNGASIISQDGSGLTFVVLNIPAIAQFVGNNSSTMNPGNGYGIQSVGGNQGASTPVVTITGPAYWQHGASQINVTWNPITTGAPCPVVAGRNSGFQVMIQSGGNVPKGPAVSLSAGRSAVPNVSWPIGSRFNVVLWDLCTNQAVSAPFPAVVQ